jgi:hypothetical protein
VQLPESGVGSKLYSSWYATNNKLAGSGYDEVHGNVETVGTTAAEKMNNKTFDLYNKLVTPDATDEFKFDLKTAFYGYRAMAKYVGNFEESDLAKYSAYTFHFIKKTYTGDDGDVTLLPNLYADGTVRGDSVFVKTKNTDADAGNFVEANLVATLDTITGVVRMINGPEGNAVDKATYANALKLLNNKTGHEKLSTTLTARIGLKVKACYIDPRTVGDGMPNLGQIPFADNLAAQYKGEFDVKFLCPITVKNDETNNVTDAMTGGEDADVKLIFTDWRDHNFTSDAHKDLRKDHNYFEYYGVKEVNLDTENARTNYNNPNETDTSKWPLVKDAIPTKKFTWTKGETKAAEKDWFTAGTPTALKRTGEFVVPGSYGKIHYENDGMNHGDYKVMFPVSVEYDWGTVKTEVIFTVNKTTGQARRR